MTNQQINRNIVKFMNAREDAPIFAENGVEIFDLHTSDKGFDLYHVIVNRHRYTVTLTASNIEIEYKGYKIMKRAKPANLANATIAAAMISIEKKLGAKIDAMNI